MTAAGEPGGNSRTWGRSRLARALCLGLLVLPALVAYRPYDQEAQIRAAAGPHAFDLVGWQVAQLRERLPALLARVGQPPSPETPVAPPEAVAAVRAYLAAGQAWRAAAGSGATDAEVAALHAAWEATREPAAEALAASLGVLASRDGLTTRTPLGDWLLPPAAFVLAEPPRVLVVSPRERIEVAQSVLLQSNTPWTDAEELEARVAALDLSGLVVQIGGIATYPAMVPFQGRPAELFSAVAHEWVHGWLIFHPLGRAWFAGYEGRTLNETVAELTGRELGDQLAAEYGFAFSRPTARRTGEQPPVEFDYRREMRATREHLDVLLAQGAVEAAEAYLEERRQAFVAAGYRIRKLNQAFFAFHGSYAESGAVVSPLETEVRALRERSASLGHFLRQVAAMSHPAEITAALAQATLAP